MEEQNKVAGFPQAGMDQDEEHSTTGDGHPPRRVSTTGDGNGSKEASTTGDGHPPRTQAVSGS